MFKTIQHYIQKREGLGNGKKELSRIQQNHIRRLDGQGTRSNIE
jgi:hypothetical protein